jgi:hypothetical protein
MSIVQFPNPDTGLKFLKPAIDRYVGRFGPTLPAVQARVRLVKAPFCDGHHVFWMTAVLALSCQGWGG